MNVFVISGFDISDCDIEKYNEWRWSSEWETYCYQQEKGNIQLFEDKYGHPLYFGYIWADDKFNTLSKCSFVVEEVNDVYRKIVESLSKLIQLGIVDKDITYKEKYQIIPFVSQE